LSQTKVVNFGVQVERVQKASLEPVFGRARLRFN
jgi:hypothetical protein